MTQTDRLHELLKDGQPHRTDEIVRVVYGDGCALARVAARINDLRKAGLLINGWKAPENGKLYYYRLVVVRDLFGEAV